MGTQYMKKQIGKIAGLSLPELAVIAQGFVLVAIALVTLPSSI